MRRAAKILALMVVMILIFKSAKSQSKEEVYLFIKSCNIKHPKIVMKQAILETGHLKSYLCKYQHNLFGMQFTTGRKTLAIGSGKNNVYAKYKSWKDSVRDYAIWQSLYYDGVQDYYEFLKGSGYSTRDTYVKTLKQIKLNIK